MKCTLDWNAYAKVARQMVAEGCVLLKNDNNVLPLGSGLKLSLFGRSQFRYIKSGTGSGGQVKAPYVVSIIDALAEEDGITLNKVLDNVYQEWLKSHPYDLGGGWKEPWFQEEMELSEETTHKAAEESDVAVVIIGRTAGEDKDNSVTEGSYLLTKTELEMLETVRKAFEKMVVLLNVGNVIDMNWVETVNPDAVMYVWQGGQEGGHGVADVLMGRVNPCGRLSDTIPYDINTYPVQKNFGDAQRNFYEEDIFVGYRYYETAEKSAVQYPFGFGLSYTNFAVDSTFEYAGDVCTLKVQVTNVGTLSGKEVVQVYFEAPQGALCKPARELIRFGKTKELKPNEAEELVFTWNVSEMSSYDDVGETGFCFAFVLEKGEYSIYVGENVREAKLTGSIKLAENRLVEQLTSSCAPTIPMKRMTLWKNEDGSVVERMEDVPLQSYDLMDRIQKDMPECIGYKGDLGYTFKDYLCGKVSLTDFVSQLTDVDLIMLTRGEGMCSLKVTKGVVGSFGGVTSRLHDKFLIPIAATSDGPSGIRMISDVPAFSLPNGTLQACSFNVDLIDELYDYVGIELRKNRIDTLLGPGLNIHRSHLNGRNFEYYSEDPYLTGACAVAELKALHRYGVTGTIKHFATNNQEEHRYSVDAHLSERALREIYLKAFEMSVKEGDAYCIMTTYGPLNGIHTAGNYDLNETILRKDWKFEGLTMTDWWAEVDPDDGGKPNKKDTQYMIRARGDVYMVNPDSEHNGNNDNAEVALQNGEINRGQLEIIAYDILKVLAKMLCSERMLQGEDEITEVNVPEVKVGMVNMLPEINLAQTDTVDIRNIKCNAEWNNRFNIVGMSSEGAIMTVVLRCEGDERTQNSVLVSLSGKNLGAIAINGTNGEWIEATVEIVVYKNNGKELNLFFPREGIEIKEIRITNK